MKTRIVHLGLGVALTALAVSPIASKADETVAQISYRAIARPTYVPADFVAARGETIRFLSVKAIDGVRDDAALCQPAGKPPAGTTLIVQDHGSGSNFYRPPMGALCRGLALKGYAMLTFNNRAHDKAINTDNFLDVRRDIEAMVATGRGLGYKRIVLAGHSLGTIQNLYYAANNWDRDIHGVILLSPFANLPWKTRNLLVENDASYEHLTEEALTAQRAGRGDQLLPDKMGYYTGEQVPVTARHFLTYRDQTTSTADGTYWIKRVPYPILITRDKSDAVIQPWEPYELLSNAHAPGSLVPSIDYVVIPDSRPPSLPAHEYPDTLPALIDTVSGWLGRHGL